MQELSANTNRETPFDLGVGLRRKKLGGLVSREYVGRGRGK